jgi:dTDP-4-amino-4,6-dideoxygalactose transaminase
MEVQITKRASDLNMFARPAIPFLNARTALKAFLLGLGFSSDDEVLLPAYVGWSKNEGSGVFDPIQEVGVKFRFYRLMRDLAIDLDDLRVRITAGRPRLLLVIHYFGYPDPGLAEAVAYARASGMLVLEDEAHALYSDWVSGICGRLGDAAIMSLHKMLPFKSGGLLVLNSSLGVGTMDVLKHSPLRKPLEQSPLDYDLVGISEVRRCNAVRLLELLQPLRGRAHPLHRLLPDGVVPQTLPVVITGKSRDELYFRLNESGYGVVSLYHTLIKPIQKSEFPDSYWLAQRILNLPVHQDVSSGALEALVTQLDRLL